MSERSEKITELKQSDIWSMNVKQLQNFIRKATMEVNYRFVEYDLSSKTPSKIMEKEKEKLSKLAGVKARGGYVGLGLRGKRKADLRKQATALKAFISTETYSDIGQETNKRKESGDKAYNTFIKNHGYIDRDEWSMFYEQMNVIKDTISGYGYENIGYDLADKYVVSKDKTSFGDLVKKAVKNLPDGSSYEDIIDMIAELTRKGKRKK